MTATVKPEPEDIKLLLDKARDRIASARALVDIEQYADAISRAYYAFFDAARAALLSKGLIAKIHKGLRLLFEQHFIRPGLFPVGIGRWLSKAETAREEADYEFRKTFTREQAEAAVKAAQEFVAEVKKLLP